MVAQFPWRSRRELASFVTGAAVRVNEVCATKKSRRLAPGDRVEIELPLPTETLAALAAVPLHLLYEDDDLVVVDKPSGFAVHPASTCQQLNLLRRLELRYQREHVDPDARPSIVHRLDRATSGVIAYARRRELVAFYTGQFEARTVRKTYAALVHGRPPATGSFTSPLVVEDATDVRVDERGKPSRTDFTVLRSDGTFSLVEVRPVTGRKHQIRVHFANGGHPLRFDDLYGRDGQPPAWPDGARLGLHAQVLELTHRNGKRLRFEASIPEALRRWTL